jgi:hypothetical protein
VQAEHVVGVAGGYVGGHAAFAEELFAALALPHVGGPHNSAADAAFVLQASLTNKAVFLIDILIISLEILIFSRNSPLFACYTPK